MNCARCNKTLRNPVMLSGVAFGSKCAGMVAGAKAKRKRRVVASHELVADPRQMNLELA